MKHPFSNFYLVWMPLSPPHFHVFLFFSSFWKSRQPQLGLTLIHINWLPYVYSRCAWTEWFPFGTLCAATGENVIFMGGEIEEMAPGSVRLTARHWSRRTALLMDIPYIASSYLMYMTCALAWCLASCPLLSPWRLTLPCTMWPIETVPPEEAPDALCGFDNIPKLFSAAITRGLTPVWAGVHCAFIGKVWAGHEMDGALTRLDKQPGPINIPLSLVSFFLGGESEGISCVWIGAQVLLGIAQIHMWHHLWLSFLHDYWRGSMREEPLEALCGHRRGCVIVWKPQRRIKCQRGAGMAPQLSVTFTGHISQTFLRPAPSMFFFFLNMLRFFFFCSRRLAVSL